MQFCLNRTHDFQQQAAKCQHEMRNVETGTDGEVWCCHTTESIQNVKIHQDKYSHHRPWSPPSVLHRRAICYTVSCRGFDWGIHGAQLNMMQMARGQSEYWNIPLCLDIKRKIHIIVMLLERRVYWICLDMFLFSMICSYENVIQLECAAVRTSCSWTQAACIGHAPCSVVPNTPTLQHCTARWESGKTGRSL